MTWKPCSKTDNRLPGRPVAGALALATALLACPALAPAVDDARPESWKADLDIHFWIPRHDVKTTTGSELEIGIDDVLQNFVVTAQATFKLRKNRWRLFGDVAWGRVSADESGSVSVPVGPLSIPTAVSAKYQEEGWIVNAGIGYNLVDDERWTLDAYGGLRFLHLDIALTLDLQTRLLPAGALRLEDSSKHFDGTVAVGGVVVLSERWYARYHADIGTGDTDSTWLAQGVLAYRFDSFDAYAGWRHIEWNGLDSDVIDDLTLTGPIVGARFRF
jgi:hypothetical protein